MKELLLWVWQLPQNLIGFIWTRFTKKETTWFLKGKKVRVCYAPCFKSGVSLGKYIILDPVYKRISSGKQLTIVQHEHGHQKQSEYFGWFYLLLVALPSVCNWDRLFHKKWTSEEREKWYYSRYPEKWADRLGGVTKR